MSEIAKAAAFRIVEKLEDHSTEIALGKNYSFMEWWSKFHGIIDGFIERGEAGARAYNAGRCDECGGCHSHAEWCKESPNNETGGP